MKTIAILFTVTFGLCLSVFAEDLAEGHWISQKVDKAKSVLITYENWFETSEDGERVFRSKVLKETPYTAPPIPNPTPNPVVTTPVSPTLSGNWVCFANDLVTGHTKHDDKDDSCVGSHYRGKGNCLDDAIQSAVASCRAHSPNKKTCEVNVEANCFSTENAPPPSQE